MRMASHKTVEADDNWLSLDEAVQGLSSPAALTQALRLLMRECLRCGQVCTFCNKPVVFHDKQRSEYPQELNDVMRTPPLRDECCFNPRRSEAYATRQLCNSCEGALLVDQAGAGLSQSQVQVAQSDPGSELQQILRSTTTTTPPSQQQQQWAAPQAAVWHQTVLTTRDGGPASTALLTPAQPAAALPTASSALSLRKPVQLQPTFANSSSWTFQFQGRERLIISQIQKWLPVNFEHFVTFINLSCCVGCARYLVAPLKRATQLRELILPHCKITPEGLAGVVNSLSQVKSFESLDLSWNAMADQCAEVLETAFNEKRLPALKHLNLTGNQFQKHAEKLVRAVIKKTIITHFSLSHNTIDDDQGVIVFEVMLTCGYGKLTHFDVSENWLFTEAGKQLAKVISHFNEQEQGIFISLRKNDFPDETATLLADCVTGTNNWVLDLSECPARVELYASLRVGLMGHIARGMLCPAVVLLGTSKVDYGFELRQQLFQAPFEGWKLNRLGQPAALRNQPAETNAMVYTLFGAPNAFDVLAEAIGQLPCLVVLFVDSSLDDETEAEELRYTVAAVARQNQQQREHPLKVIVVDTNEAAERSKSPHRSKFQTTTYKSQTTQQQHQPKSQPPFPVVSTAGAASSSPRVADSSAAAVSQQHRPVVCSSSPLSPAHYQPFSCTPTNKPLQLQVVAQTLSKTQTPYTEFRAGQLHELIEAIAAYIRTPADDMPTKVFMEAIAQLCEVRQEHPAFACTGTDNVLCIMSQENFEHLCKCRVIIHLESRGFVCVDTSMLRILLPPHTELRGRLQAVFPAAPSGKREEFALDLYDHEAEPCISMMASLGLIVPIPEHRLMVAHALAPPTSKFSDWRPTRAEMVLGRRIVQSESQLPMPAVQWSCIQCFVYVLGKQLERRPTWELSAEVLQSGIELLFKGQRSRIVCRVIRSAVDAVDIWALGPYDHGDFVVGLVTPITQLIEHVFQGASATLSPQPTTPLSHWKAAKNVVVASRRTSDEPTSPCVEARAEESPSLAAVNEEPESGPAQEPVSSAPAPEPMPAPLQPEVVTSPPPTHITSPSDPPLVLALSVDYLRRDDVGVQPVPGYDMRVLLKKQPSDQVQPTHPVVLQLTETVSDLLGDQPQDAANPWPEFRLGPGEPLRILVVRANTRLFECWVTKHGPKTGSLNTDQEDKLIKMAAEQSRFASRIEVQSIGFPTRADLGRMLETFQPHCLHFAGHGTARGIELASKMTEKCRVSSEMSGDGSDPPPMVTAVDVVSALELRDLLGLSNSLVVAVLNCCNSASVISPLRSKCSVISCQSEPSDQDAVRFARRFWYGLLKQFALFRDALQTSFASAMRRSRGAQYELFCRVGQSAHLNHLMVAQVGGERKEGEGESESQANASTDLLVQLEAWDKLGAKSTCDGNHADAAAYHERAFGFACLGGFLQDMNITLDNISVAYQSVGDTERTERYLFAAVRVAQRLDDQEGLYLAHSALGNLFCGQHAYVDALKHLNYALESVDPDNGPAQARILVTMARCSRHLHTPEDTRRYLQLATEASLASDDQDSVALVCMEEGSIAELAGDWVLAANRYEAALAAGTLLYERDGGSPEPQLAALLALAQAEEKLPGRSDSARRRLDRCVALARQAENTMHLSKAMALIGQQQVRAGQLAEAMGTLNAAEALAKQHNHPAVRAEAQCAKGEANLAMQQLADASACLDDALAWYRTINDGRGVARVNLLISKVLQQRHLFMDSCVPLQGTLEMARKLADLKQEEECRRLLGIAYFHTAQPEKAVPELRRAFELLQQEAGKLDGGPERLPGFRGQGITREITDTGCLLLQAYMQLLNGARHNVAACTLLAGEAAGYAKRIMRHMTRHQGADRDQLALVTDVLRRLGVQWEEGLPDETGRELRNRSQPTRSVEAVRETDAVNTSNGQGVGAGHATASSSADEGDGSSQHHTSSAAIDIPDSSLRARAASATNSSKTRVADPICVAQPDTGKGSHGSGQLYGSHTPTNGKPPGAKNSRPPSQAASRVRREGSVPGSQSDASLPSPKVPNIDVSLCVSLESSRKASPDAGEGIEHSQLQQSSRLEAHDEAVTNATPEHDQLHGATELSRSHDEGMFEFDTDTFQHQHEPHQPLQPPSLALADDKAPDSGNCSDVGSHARAALGSGTASPASSEGSSVSLRVSPVAKNSPHPPTRMLCGSHTPASPQLVTAAHAACATPASPLASAATAAASSPAPHQNQATSAAAFPTSLAAGAALSGPPAAAIESVSSAPTATGGVPVVRSVQVPDGFLEYEPYTSSEESEDEVDGKDFDGGSDGFTGSSHTPVRHSHPRGWMNMFLCVFVGFGCLLGWNILLQVGPVLEAQLENSCQNTLHAGPMCRPDLWLVLIFEPVQVVVALYVFFKSRQDSPHYRNYFVVAFALMAGGMAAMPNTLISRQAQYRLGVGGALAVIMAVATGIVKASMYGFALVLQHAQHEPEAESILAEGACGSAERGNDGRAAVRHHRSPRPIAAKGCHRDAAGSPLSEPLAQLFNHNIVAIQVGEALAGVVVSGLGLVLHHVGCHELLSLQLYFWIGAGLCLMCAVIVCASVRKPLHQRWWSSFTRRPSGSSSIVSNALKPVWPLVLALFLCYFATLAVFPGQFYSLIPKNNGERRYQLLVLLLTWNTSDLVGRLFGPLISAKSVHNHRSWLLGAAIVRVGIVPLFYMYEHTGPVHLSGWSFVFASAIPTGLTCGLLSVLCMQTGPLYAGQRRRSRWNSSNGDDGESQSSLLRPDTKDNIARRMEVTAIFMGVVFVTGTWLGCGLSVTKLYWW